MDEEPDIYIDEIHLWTDSALKDFLHVRNWQFHKEKRR